MSFFGAFNSGSQASLNKYSCKIKLEKLLDLLFFLFPKVKNELPRSNSERHLAIFSIV